MSYLSYSDVIQIALIDQIKMLSWLEGVYWIELKLSFHKQPVSRISEKNNV